MDINPDQQPKPIGNRKPRRGSAPMNPHGFPEFPELPKKRQKIQSMGGKTHARLNFADKELDDLDAMEIRDSFTPEISGALGQLGLDSLEDNEKS
jgi:hypothetical protein